MVIAFASPNFSAPETMQNTPKLPLLHYAILIDPFMRRSADLSRKHVYWGEKRNPEQNTDLEMRIKKPHGIPKTTIQ